jgi:hypothetical protein
MPGIGRRDGGKGAGVGPRSDADPALYRNGMADGEARSCRSWLAHMRPFLSIRDYWRSRSPLGSCKTSGVTTAGMRAPKTSTSNFEPSLAKAMGR